MMKTDHAFRLGRVDIFDVRTRVYLPILQGKNAIGAHDCFWSMSDNNSSDFEIPNSGVNLGLVKDVQMAGRFVEY